MRAEKHDYSPPPPPPATYDLLGLTEKEATFLRDLMHHVYPVGGETRAVHTDLYFAVNRVLPPRGLYAFTTVSPANNALQYRFKD